MSDRSPLPHVDGYPNGLSNTIVEWYLRSLIDGYDTGLLAEMLLE